MASRIREFIEHLKTYTFQLKHVTVLLVVVLLFQLVVSFLHKASLQKFLGNTQQWYQQDSAERLANLTTTSLELLLENRPTQRHMEEREIRKMVQGLDIILSQQILSQNVKEVCILVNKDSAVAAIDDGQVIFAYMFGDRVQLPPATGRHDEAIVMYRALAARIRREEQIHTVVQGKQTFHVFVPFVPRGEFVGVVYMKTSPDFSFMTRDIITSYDETAMTFSALILFGFLAMFFISSYTLKERDDTQKLLFDNEKQHLTVQITHQKEMMFTKRIYHTHHKAEKVMGFIKEDLRRLAPGTIEEVKERMTRYASFIARVIYDMKWYDPPVQTIRGPHFDTDINDVLRFLMDNVFRRVAGGVSAFSADLRLDPAFRHVQVNEFVLWEALEPLIQNCLEHAGIGAPRITITTEDRPESRAARVIIADNGVGFAAPLLERNARGIKLLFQENVSTKSQENQHSGYGCYIAYELITQRCGWQLDADNAPEGGARFTITIPTA
jgi:anti-sigma regulatory factor (Ser/Thr protein kinase)